MKKISILIIGLLSLAPMISFATTFVLDAVPRKIGLDSDVELYVHINTRGKTLNAVSGKVVFPADVFDVKEIQSGNSKINFWIQNPSETSPGEISFSGITPGGFSGPDENLFYVILHTKREADSIVRLSDVQAFINDGKGTEDTVTTSALELQVSGSFASSTFNMPKDTQPPENFRPAVGKDPDIYGGKYFLVFVAEDKGSGIGGYEVKEGFWGAYTTATSPYLLSDQSLGTRIYIKATDKAGNGRVAMLDAQNPNNQFTRYLIFAILLITCIFLFTLLKV